MKALGKKVRLLFSFTFSSNYPKCEQTIPHIALIPQSFGYFEIGGRTLESDLGSSTVIQPARSSLGLAVTKIIPRVYTVAKIFELVVIGAVAFVCMANSDRASYIDCRGGHCAIIATLVGRCTRQRRVARRWFLVVR